jgi:hypothetical protein
MGLVCAKNASEKFSRLGTFKKIGELHVQKIYENGQGKNPRDTGTSLAAKRELFLAINLRFGLLTPARGYQDSSSCQAFTADRFFWRCLSSC